MISWPYKLSMMFYMTTDQMSYAHEFGPKKVNHQHNLEGSSNLERKLQKKFFNVTENIRRQINCQREHAL